MGRALYAARDLLWRLLWRDLRLRIKVSFLGLLWSLIHPVLLVAIFVRLRSDELLSIGETAVPYVVFAYIGALHWNLFFSILIQSSNSLLGASNLVARVPFPREVLTLSACGRALFDWLCALPFLVGLLVWFGVSPDWTWLLLPLALAPLLLIGVGVGMLLAMLALPIRDVGQALPLIQIPLLFLTPVVYPLPDSGWWPVLWIVNPVAVSIDSLRDCLCLGRVQHVTALAVWLVVAVVVFMICWWLFDRVMRRVPEFA